MTSTLAAGSGSTALSAIGCQIGASKVAHVDEAVGALGYLAFTAAELAEIDAALK